MTTVGVIGVGKMGLPIARNLMAAGFDVLGYRRHSLEDLVASGGVAAESPAALAAASDVVLSILPDAAALREVMLGDHGTVAAVRPGTVHIEMSTLVPAEKEPLRQLLAEHGGDMLDCPISGSPPMVQPRQATTFVSGLEDTVEQVRPVLDAISGPWVYTGPFGTGARMKYVANLLMAVHTVVTAEALLFAEAIGLDQQLVQTTLNGTIASSTIWERRGPMMRDRRWLPAPGPIATLHPILGQIEQIAAEYQTDTSMFHLAKAAFDQAVADGWADRDIAAVYALLETRNRKPRAQAPIF
jgi:3-hydroxyisobutyrate dehydrogenase